MADPVPMIPVLAVRDVAAASTQLAAVFGFRHDGPGRMALGAARVALVTPDARPAGLVALRIDHVAFVAADVDATHATMTAAGALLDPRFTPAGPQDIPAFWEAGMRYVFFAGPEGAPLEFCTGHGMALPDGHAHVGIRAADLDAAEAELADLGARRVATHRLPAVPRPVAVRFVIANATVFELFDAAPSVPAVDGLGWIGLLPGLG